jgi:predicted ATP-grasp superfamily ATP-dependent carboligase
MNIYCEMNSRKIINVLIPDGESILAMSVIRCLSDVEFVHIHLVSSKKWVESRFSNKISTFSHHNCADSEVQFIDFLKNVVLENDIHVVLPILLPAIRLLSKFKKDFEPFNVNIIAADEKQLDLANNKGHLSDLLFLHKIPHPETFYLSNLGSHKILEYPLLLKPKTGWNGNKIYVIKEENDFLNITSTINDKDNYLVQNYISGYDIDMSIICLNGDILSHTIQKGYVNSSKSFAPPMAIEFLDNDEIYRIVQKLMKLLNWNGVAHIDLRYDEIKNEFVVIEINPRFWGSVNASAKVGVNFPYLYCLTSMGENFTSPSCKHKRYANNRGLLKIICSKLLIFKAYNFPHKTNLMDDILDPLPKLFKYITKGISKFSLKGKDVRFVLHKPSA